MCDKLSRASAHFEAADKETLAPGPHIIRVEFTYDGGGIGQGGTAKMTVDGKEAATVRIERTIPIRVSLDESFDVGEDTGTPVTMKYDVPFKFTGTIEKVVIDLQ